MAEQFLREFLLLSLTEMSAQKIRACGEVILLFSFHSSPLMNFGVSN